MNTQHVRALYLVQLRYQGNVRQAVQFNIRLKRKKKRKHVTRQPYDMWLIEAIGLPRRERCELPYEDAMAIVPIVQIRKLRIRMLDHLTQSNTTIKWQNWDFLLLI